MTENTLNNLNTEQKTRVEQKHLIKQKSNNKTGNKQYKHWSEECRSKEV
jgi:hypothetical protein